MKFCIENISDIKKYFSGSFVKFNGLRGKHSDGREIEASENIHTIDQIIGESIRGKRWEGENVIPYTFTLFSEEHPERCPDIEVILPRKSFFNAPDGCWFLTRIPARQYSRGITHENTSLQKLEYGDFCGKDLSGPRLEAYVNKPMFLDFAKRGVSYAVSSRIAVGDVEHYVYVDTVVIGKVDYDMKEIRVLPIFHAELNRVLDNHGQYDWKVVSPSVPKKKYKKGDVKPKQSNEVSF